MARRKKKKAAVTSQGWLVAFASLMILILTFFVYLVANASLDERRIRLAIGSLMGTFGIGTLRPDLLGEEQLRDAVQPGPMPEDQDLSPLKELLWDDLDEELQFVSNRFVQIFSVNTAALFAPGETELSDQGKAILQQVAPTLRLVEQPVLIAGHASVLRDELGEDHRLEMLEEIPDPSWRLALFRAMSVYRYLLELGVSPELLRMEGLGRFHPRETPLTPEGRLANRRVEFILDKRAQDWTPKLERLTIDPTKEQYIYRDFIFRFPENHGPLP